MTFSVCLDWVESCGFALCHVMSWWLLSCAGNVTLAKSVMVVMATYTMQNLLIMQGTRDDIDVVVGNFILGKNSCHWMNWHTMVKLKSVGGLGVCTSRKTNTNLFGKHVWVMFHNQDKLCMQLLPSKHVKILISFMWLSKQELIVLGDLPSKHQINLKRCYKIRIT